VSATRLQALRERVDIERRRQLGLRLPGVDPGYCRGLTQQGEPCRWRARASGFCSWHERQQLADGAA
jgi:hypothetical protein